MPDDFCLIHGYEHMRNRLGDPIPHCAACDKTLADDLAAEGEQMRRRFVHATRPKDPLSLDQARELGKRMSGAVGQSTLEK